MGEDLESVIDGRNPTLATGEDTSVARDIAKRFEQLESQWLHFQKRSETWEGKKGLAADPALLNNRDLDLAVPSAAFAYSNPLFSSHKTFKRRLAGNLPRTSSFAENSVTSLSSVPEKWSQSQISKRVPILPPSEGQLTIHKERFLPAYPSPLRSSLSATGSSDRKRQSFYGTLHANGNLSSSCLKTTFPMTLGCEASPKPRFSVTAGRRSRNAFLPDYPRDTKNRKGSSWKCPPTLPIHERTSNLKLSPESFTSSKFPALDPANYSSGKGPPGLQLPPFTEEPQPNEVANSSKSPRPVTPSASARDIDLLSDVSTTGSHLRGSQQRNDSRRMVVDEQAILEARKMFSGPVNPQNSKGSAARSPRLGSTEFSMSNGKTFKSDIQMDWKDRKDISTLVQHKLDHTVSKVEWELRLSTKESQLRLAEDRLLEEQQKLSETRLAISKCEDALFRREQAVNRLEQKRDLGATLESVETGNLVMGKLIAALRDILSEMERKESALHELWNEVKRSCEHGSAQDCKFGLQPSQLRARAFAIDLDGINLLTANGDGKEWCEIVINICEKLVDFLSQETHLQKWAVLLEQESLKMKSLEEEMMTTKEATDEQFERATEMMRKAEEQTRMAEEERTTLSKERESIVLWVSRLQERRKAITESEREAASSLAEVQKRAASLSVHESSIDGKALEISALHEELWATSLRLHDDQELVNKERMRLQEKFRQVSSREKDADLQLQEIRRSKEEMQKQHEQFEKEAIAEETKRERALNLQRDLEVRLNARELTLRDIESDLEEKALAAESLAAQLQEREKILKSMHEHCEMERLKTKESMADLEREKRKLKESEEAIREGQRSKKNADEAWARVAKERREADEYLKSVEDRIKAWEDKLRVKEKELQQQQYSLWEIESRIQEEQDQSRALRDKFIVEQDTWTEEIRAKQDSLGKRSKILENKEAEIKNDLEKLTEERKLAMNEIKRFAEMEARAWAAERELQSKHDEHLQEVRKHAKEYRAHVEELKVARRDVEREFEEIHTKRDELKIWQTEAEETLQSKIESFTKGKDELQIQIQELKRLQLDIEQVGAQIIDRVAELDQASSKLEVQRKKVELSKSKLEDLARNLAQQQELMKEREKKLLAQEEKISSALTDVKKMTDEAAAKEEDVKYREQAVVENEHGLQELEARLTNERGNLERMITEVERHATKLKEESASAEETSSERSRHELLLEERRRESLAKQEELSAFESTLKIKALSLEENGKALAKLEHELQERLHRSQDIEKGWEKLRDEQAAFEIQKEDMQNWKAERDQKAKMDGQWKALLREELERQKLEMLSTLKEKEQALHVKESKLMAREASVQGQKRRANIHVKKDAHGFRAQFNKAHPELDANVQFVEEEGRVAEGIAATMEDKKARLELKEKEIEKREKLLDEREKSTRFSEVRVAKGLMQPAPASDLVSHAKDYTQARDFPRRPESQGNDTNDESIYRMTEFDQTAISPERSSEEDLEESSTGRDRGCLKEDHNVSKQCLNQMEADLQQEASKIIQERANLKAQQKELEETRKAVQDVKVTLTAQLKATKQMVADAALTAQNASREREALEEERRRLDRVQRETQTLFAAKETKILNETKHLENLRACFFQEKTQAMDHLQQAALVAKDERIKASKIQVEQKGRHAEADFKERDKRLFETAETLHLENITLQGEKASLKMLHEALERGQYEPSCVPFQQHEAIEAQREPEGRKLWDVQNIWKEDSIAKDLQSMPPGWNDRDAGRPEVSENFNSPFGKDQMIRHDVHTRNESCRRASLDFVRSPAYISDQNGASGASVGWNDMFNKPTLLSSPESSAILGAKVHQMPVEKRALESCQHVHEEKNPSKKRLDNVMTSLINARQASRSRLQRTENALLGFPPSSPYTGRVQQALNALSARLGLMEQIEDGLASHLRKAYEVDYPDAEGVLVDKVQLLSRMEEQQSLRAEWEEDMQQQLETISMLQAASRDTSSLVTPDQRAHTLERFQSPLSSSEWQTGVSEDPNRRQSHRNQDSDGSRIPNMVATNSGSSGSTPSQQYHSPPERKMAFEPLLGVDSTGLSFSPLVEYNCHPSSRRSSSLDLLGREPDERPKLACRKLDLSPSTDFQYPSR